MKAIIDTKTAAKTLRMMILAGMVIILAAACDRRGRDGRDGRAFLALEWEVDRPDYIDAGTPDIPPTFEWGRSYRAYPGWYTLYYEGRFWNGYANALYAWEIEYEIWEAEGERGGYYYDGEDGPDSYFTLIMSPYGPVVDEYVTKMAATTDGSGISETNDAITFSVEKEGFGMHVTYRKVEPRERD